MQNYRKLLKDRYIVPQNSVSTFNQRANHGVNKAVECPHCEIMAKNFLYLESLIRNNYNPKIPCKLCFAALKYLQFVNKSIMSVFGSCDGVVNASRCFFGPVKKQPSRHTQLNKRKSVVNIPKKTKTKRIKAGGGTIERSAKIVEPPAERNANCSAAVATQVVAAANSHEYTANPKSAQGKSSHKVANKKLPSSSNISNLPQNVIKNKTIRRSASKKCIKRLG